MTSLTSPDPIYPSLIETQFSHYLREETPLYSIVGFLHIHFDFTLLSSTCSLLSYVVKRILLHNTIMLYELVCSKTTLVWGNYILYEWF